MDISGGQVSHPMIDGHTFRSLIASERQSLGDLLSFAEEILEASASGLLVLQS